MDNETIQRMATLKRDEMKYGSLTLYRDDSTAVVKFDNVKHFFWNANNTVLVIAQVTDVATGAHHYVHWPRERFTWFKHVKP